MEWSRSGATDRSGAADDAPRFAKTGPDRLEMIDIHERPQFITEWI